MPDLAERPEVLIIGLGAEDRGDDGVGRDVVRDLRDAPPPGAALAEDPGDLTRLLDLWEGRRLVILVDAVRTGAKVGSVHRWSGSEIATRDPQTFCSTHGFSITYALELGRALDRVPKEVVLVGVEIAEADEGRARSPAVRAAGRAARAMVFEELARHGRLNPTGPGGPLAHA